MCIIICIRLILSITKLNSYIEVTKQNRSASLAELGMLYFLINFVENVCHMFFKIEFNQLPFQPAKQQVIYIENEYNEKINRFIQTNYGLFVITSDSKAGTSATYHIWQKI